MFCSRCWLLFVSNSLDIHCPIRQVRSGGGCSLQGGCSQWERCSQWGRMLLPLDSGYLKHGGSRALGQWVGKILNQNYLGCFIQHMKLLFIYSSRKKANCLKHFKTNMQTVLSLPVVNSQNLHRIYKSYNSSIKYLRILMQTKLNDFYLSNYIYSP